MRKIIKAWWDTRKIIKTKITDACKQKYLRKVEARSFDELTLPKADNLFWLVIGDFKKGKLSSDDLSCFGFFLFHAVAKHHPSSFLFNATLSASELSFAMRNPAVYRNIKKYFEDIDNFYEKHTPGVCRTSLLMEEV